MRDASKRDSKSLRVDASKRVTNRMRAVIYFRISNLVTLICSRLSFQNWGTKYLESYTTYYLSYSVFNINRDSLSRSYLAVGNDVTIRGRYGILVAKSDKATNRKRIPSLLFVSRNSFTRIYLISFSHLVTRYSHLAFKTERSKSNNHSLRFMPPV